MDSLVLIPLALVIVFALSVRKFMVLNPDFWMAMGMVLIDMKRYERAICCFDRTVKLYPFYVYAFGNKGLALYEMGRCEDAVKSYDKAIELNPLFAEGWYNKGLAFKKMGLDAEAEDAFLRAGDLGIK